jgi:hypothetical protein
MPDSLARILADESISKIGVAIHDDILSLRKLNDFKPAGLLSCNILSRITVLKTMDLRSLLPMCWGLK